MSTALFGAGVAYLHARRFGAAVPGVRGAIRRECHASAGCAVHLRAAGVHAGYGPAVFGHGPLRGALTRPEEVRLPGLLARVEPPCGRGADAHIEDGSAAVGKLYRGYAVAVGLAALERRAELTCGAEACQIR